MSKILRLHEYASNEGHESTELNFDETVISALVELVGSEEEVEAAAKEAFDELSSSFEKDEIQLKEGDLPEKLAMSALLVKLVELGKVGPEEADSFIATHLEPATE